MSLKLSLGLHLGFAITRYPEPEQWAKLSREEFDINHVQFVSDLLQPNFPERVINEQIKEINSSLKKYDLKTLHTFTSPRWNFFGHPDKKIREYWLWWFKKFAKISKDIGAFSTGSLLGIYSVNDLKKRGNFIEDEVINNWQKLAEYSRSIGLKLLTWEPMSIKREMGETIAETKRLLNILNQNKPSIPIMLCLDVDHGDVFSKNKKDLDPYSWLRVFGKESPTIQIKQRTKNVFGHKPFTSEHNKDGIIKPDKVIEALEESGAKNVMLILELSFREREPYESNVIKDIKASVNYWRNYVQD